MSVEVLRMTTETLGQHLRKLAQRADLGDFRSGVFVFVSGNGDVDTSWWFDPLRGDVNAALGGTLIVQSEIITLQRDRAGT